MPALSFRDRVSRIAKGLIASGIQPGERVGFLCGTRYEWTLFDFALWYAGAVMVPIYETSSAVQLEWILADSEAVACVVETKGHFSRLELIRAGTPLVTQAWVLELGALDEFEQLGETVPDEVLESRRSLARGSDLATLIYTSGSSGKPKGCILTHTNFVDLARNDGVAVQQIAYPGASTLLFITLAHVFARFVSVLAVHTGVKVGHQADLTQLMPSFGSFKPSFLLAVPRVFEKVYNSAEAKAEAAGKGKVFHAAADAAIEYSKALEKGKVPLALKMKYALLNRLVLARLRAALGGNVTDAISGSAPLSERMGHFYRGLGVRIIEGYGLTESTAPATFNLPDRLRFGTVGRPVPGMSVRVDDDGEILLKGPSIFAGYWKNPTATAEATDGGWFRTGDIGRLDDDGFLTITGRKKEIIVTAGGKNVAPAALEDPVRSHPLVSQIVVVGDQRPFIGALITLDADMLPTWLGNNGLDETLSLAEAAVLPEVRTAIQSAIDQANAQVSRAESIRKFSILQSDFSEATGHMTPKLSIKRFAILRDFSEEIEALYSASSVGDSTETIGING